MKTNKNIVKSLKNLFLDVNDGAGSVHGMPTREQALSLSQKEISLLRCKEIVKNGLDLARLEDNAHNRAWVSNTFSSEEEYLEAILGAEGTKRLLKALKSLDIKLNIWTKEVQRDGLSPNQKGWKETLAHGIVEGSVQYVMEEDGQRRILYDGDMEIDPTKGPGEQLSRGFVIPYVREKSSRSVIGRDANGSFCKKEINKGDVVMAGKYPTMAVYLAPSLPCKELVLVQDKLSQFVESGQWARFNKLLACFRDYRKSCGDRDSSVKDVSNGMRRVYYKEYNGCVLFSPITFGELSDSQQKAIEARFQLQKLGEELLIEAPSVTPETWKSFQGRVQAFVDGVRQSQAWYLWKGFVAPLRAWWQVDDSEVSLFD